MQNNDKKKHFIVIAGKVRFDGKCEETKSFCGAVCCRNTIVFLSQKEVESGKYEYQEPTPNCMCAICQTMRSTKTRALQRNESGCIYLDGTGKCSIYEDRPQKCRDFECTKVWWNLQLSNSHPIKRGEVNAVGGQNS